MGEIWDAIISFFGGGGANLGAAALEQAPQAAQAAGTSLASFYPSSLSEWLMLGQLGLGGVKAGMQAFGGGPEGMPLGEVSPNLMFGTSPQQAKARLAGASADLQARGLYGASPDFMERQLETDTGLTPTEFDQAFRTGGMRSGGSS